LRCGKLEKDGDKAMNEENKRKAGDNKTFCSKPRAMKISRLAGVDDENFMINEVDLYMKDKWNSFTRDLQEFLEQQSDSKEIDYNEDQLLQIVNFIHITKDRYTTGMSKKVPNLGRSEQLNIATAYRDLRNSVKKMIG
ncbi:hypothetical protein Tco_0534845, partial [Tanacetum coccineum]